MCTENGTLSENHTQLTSSLEVEISKSVIENLKNVSKGVGQSTLNGHVLYGYVGDLGQRGSDILNLYDKIGICCTGMQRIVIRHKATNKGKIGHVANSCGERFCVRCYKGRKASIVSRFRPEWESMRPDQRVSHIMLSFGSYTKDEMTSYAVKEMKRKLKLFFLRLRRKTVNLWGHYVFEYKWRPSKGIYTPHVHIICCGFSPNSDQVRGAWKEINGGEYREAWAKFGRPRSYYKSKSEWIEYLTRRRMNMLHYLAKRSAGAGLVLDNVKTHNGKDREVVLGSVPVNFYLDVIKGSRMINSFGKMNYYKIVNNVLKHAKKPNYKDPNRDREVKRSPIPVVVLQRRQQRRHEIELKRLEYAIYGVDFIKYAEPFVMGSAPPPPKSPSFERIKKKLIEMELEIDDDQSWKLAYSAVVREIREAEKLKKNPMIGDSTLEEVRARHKSVHQGDSWNHITYEESL